MQGRGELEKRGHLCLSQGQRQPRVGWEAFLSALSLKAWTDGGHFCPLCFSVPSHQLPSRIPSALGMKAIQSPPSRLGYPLMPGYWAGLPKSQPATAAPSPLPGS